MELGTHNTIFSRDNSQQKEAISNGDLKHKGRMKVLLRLLKLKIKICERIYNICH